MCLKTIKHVANIVDPDQMPHHATSDMDLH